MDLPITLAAAPTITLAPIAPLGVDQGSLDAITPTTSNQLWYGSSGTVARINITYQYPAVALDQSHYIGSISCSGSTLTATFNNTDVYHYASSIWQQATQLIFVTSASSCNNDGQNIFFQASTVVCTDSSTSCSATGTLKELADIFSTLGADWGSVTPTATSDSPSDTTNATTTCSAAPSSSISGLPAAGCGTSFDQAVDTALGFYSGADEDVDSVLAQIAPGASSGSTRKRSTSSQGTTKGISAVGSAIKTIVTTVDQAIKAAFQGGVKGAARSFGTAAKSLARAIVAFTQGTYNLAKYIITGDYDQPFNVDLLMQPPTNVLSRSGWNSGQLGLEMYKFLVDSTDPGYSVWRDALDRVAAEIQTENATQPGLNFWCVGCDIQGQLQATGTVSANTNGLSNGQITVNGSMNADLFLGIDAFATITRSFNTTLLHKDLTTYTIPKIFKLGPSLEIGIISKAQIQAVGQVLTGASLSWPALTTTLDVLGNSQSGTSGFTPAFNQTLQATNSVSLTPSLSLPYSLSFTVDILNGKFTKQASITETWSLTA